MCLVIYSSLYSLKLVAGKPRKVGPLGPPFVQATLKMQVVCRSGILAETRGLIECCLEPEVRSDPERTWQSRTRNGPLGDLTPPHESIHPPTPHDPRAWALISEQRGAGIASHRWVPDLTPGHFLADAVIGFFVVNFTCQSISSFKASSETLAKI